MALRSPSRFGRYGVYGGEMVQGAKDRDACQLTELMLRARHTDASCAGASWSSCAAGKWESYYVTFPQSTPMLQAE